MENGTKMTKTLKQIRAVPVAYDIPSQYGRE